MIPDIIVVLARKLRIPSSPVFREIGCMNRRVKVILMFGFPVELNV
jgi:hypothetical protein